MNRPSTNVKLLFCALATLLLSHAPMEAQRQTDRLVEFVNGREALSREILVKFREMPRPDQLNDIGSLADADSIRPVGRSGVQRLRSRSISVAALLQQLTNHPDILYAEPNYIVHTFSEPNEPAFPQLWGLRNTGQAVNTSPPGTAGADIHAVSAWDLTVGSTAQVVAVVDTGIDYTHPDLAGNMWSAPSAFQVTIEGTTITCPAGSHGFNAVARTCDPRDNHEHGTHVSGTIGASGNNAMGVVGVNWITRLMGIKTLDQNGSGTITDAIAGIEFAIQAKQAFAPASGANVRVLSASWGSTEFSQALLDEINRANDADMLFVAAAGNSGISNDILPTYPASYDAPNIISVAATTNTDSRAWFSNYGSSVHLGAPGMDIFSTTPGNTYSFRNGTSMATPHVSGAAVLVLSQCALDTATLKDTLLSTVEPVASLASTTVTGGRLDVDSAIRSCTAPPAAPAALSALAGDGQVALTWTGAAGALSFNVKRSLAAGGPYTVIASGVKGKTYTDTAVVNDTTYYYVVSGVNTMGESGDSNEAAATPKVPSDLIISALTVPSKGGAGIPLVLSITIKNQGPGASSATTTRFYLSENSTIGATDDLLNGVQAVPVLQPGAVSAASVSLDIPPDTPVDTLYIVAKADGDNLEAETQESNNTLSRVVSFGPELDMSLSAPSTAAPGGSILATDTVKNLGGAPAAATTTRFYLSTNTQLDAADLVLSGTRSVPALAPGSTSSGSTAVVIPATVTTGSYYLFALADADHAVLETLESNNDDLKLIQVGGDLTVSSMSVPSTGGAGTAIVVTDTIKNEGAGPVGASTTRFYLSTTIQLGPSALLLSESRGVHDLAAGATSVGSTTIVVPSTVETGLYYLIAKADGGDEVQETRENNNTSSRNIKIGGDLVVTGLSAPATAGAGLAISVSETTKNTGAGPVSASMTRFYLSTNAALDASDTPLTGGRSVPGLPAGGTSAGSTTVTIPSTVVAGSYYLIAKADADSTAPETEESNNTALRSLPVGGDLSVSALTVPAKGGAGGSIVVTDTTMNKGAGDAAASITRFYLSLNSSLDATDTLLAGSRAVDQLAAGASSSGSTTLTLPSPLAVGGYYVIAKSDADNAVEESQETNNTLARSIAVGPDFTISSVSVTFNVAAGSTVPVTDVVQNQGGEAAGATTTRFFLSANVLFDAGDLPLNASRAVPELAAGASSTGSTPVTIPAGTTPAYYYVIAVSDADGVVAEATESNNAGARTIRVIAGP